MKRTGKDKAKYLKSLKNERQSQSQSHANPQVSEAKMASQKRQKTQSESVVPPQPTSVSQSSAVGLPSDFFDDANATSEVKVEVEVEVGPGLYSSQKRKANPNEIIATKIASSNVPSDFFDDPMEELAARGISEKTFKNMQDTEGKDQLGKLMEEITALEEKV